MDTARPGSPIFLVAAIAIAVLVGAHALLLGMTGDPSSAVVALILLSLGGGALYAIVKESKP